ncbi:MAG: Inner rane transporter permease protein YejB [Bacteroidota bacterium]|jgi:peptide/nickel transport system permease protein
MLTYILKRILLFVPTLFVVSLLAFEISIHAPGDAAEMLVKNSQGSTEQTASSANYQQQITQWKHRLGLDLPVFYCSIHSLAITDTLYRITDKFEQEIVGRKMLNDAGFKKYIPTISFHFSNQYHKWMFGDGEFSKGIIRGDFGISILSQQKISTLIAEKLPWSLFFSMVSILLAYLVSIPLGVFAASKKGTSFEKIISLIVFVLPAMPSFWVATMLLMLFSNPDFFNWFPSSGVSPIQGFQPSIGFMQRFFYSIPYLILPIICFTYSSIAFLSRTMRIGILNELQQDYIRTARAKGLTEKKIIWHHAFRNSLLPIITVFASVFPAVIGGSVILETIFTLPGMGRAIYQAIGNHDYNLIVAVFTLTGFLTMVGFLISDILYTIADPRIRFEK